MRKDLDRVRREGTLDAVRDSKNHDYSLGTSNAPVVVHSQKSMPVSTYVWNSHGTHTQEELRSWKGQLSSREVAWLVDGRPLRGPPSPQTRPSKASFITPDAYRQ